MARTKGAKNKIKTPVTKYLVVWGDLICEMFDTMGQAKEKVNELINYDGEEAEYIYIFPVSDAFKVNTAVLTEKVNITKVTLG